MPRTREHSLPTRQIYASIREDIYLAAKGRAAELRLPMRRFIEEALASAIASDTGQGDESSDMRVGGASRPISLWQDQYLAAQARQPLGTPLVLSEDEARRVVLEAFLPTNDQPERSLDATQERIDDRIRGDVGDPVDFSDEDAAELARNALMLDLIDSNEDSDG